MSSYTTIFFDLDGTLLNPGDGILEAVRFTLEHYGIKETDPQKIHAFVGPPLKHCFAPYFSGDEAKIDEAVALCRKHYSEEGLHEYTPYPGIEELLIALKASGKSISVATNKLTHFAETALNAHKLTGNFDHIIGNDLENTRDSKTKVIEHLLTLLPGAPKSSCIMIGDTKYDLLGARETGIDSIAVLYGYGSADDLQKEQPTYVAKHVTDLWGFLL